MVNKQEKIIPFIFKPFDSFFDIDYSNEKWISINDNRIIDGYKVSDMGRVQNINGKILKQSNINSGYLQVRLFKNKEYRINNKSNNRYVSYTTHRLVLNNFSPIKNSKNFTVNHNNGDKHDNRLSNLSWMSQKENSNHAKINGLACNEGENSRFAKFTNIQVENICKFLQDTNLTYKDILNNINYPVTDNAIDMVGNIKRRIAWRSISKNYTW